MKTSIDESGSFAPSRDGRSSVSCIGALTIPDGKEDSLFAEFKKLKSEWGLIGPPKRGQLNEPEILSTTERLLTHGSYLQVAITDTGFTEESVIESYKRIAVEGIKRNITDNHHPNLRKELQRLWVDLESLAFPNYIQYSLMTALIDRIYRDMTLWEATQSPLSLRDSSGSLTQRTRN
jgi:hypothetical protein